MQKGNKRADFRISCQNYKLRSQDPRTPKQLSSPIQVFDWASKDKNKRKHDWKGIISCSVLSINVLPSLLKKSFDYLFARSFFFYYHSTLPIH